MVNIKDRDDDDIERTEKNKSGKITGGSVVVTEEEIVKDRISGGSAVVVNNRVDVNKISGGTVVICFGPVNVDQKITGGASVISSQRIDVGKLSAAANLAAAPEVNVEGSNRSRILTVPQALRDPRVKSKLNRKFDIDLEHETPNSLPELVDK